jgi:hypothetical protein
MRSNFWSGHDGNGLWPRGKYGSFALCGNHEMYSSGLHYLKMISNPARKFGIRQPGTEIYSGQPSPNFCLRSPHWLVIGLDTGYDSLKVGIHLSATNTRLTLPDVVEKWLREKVIDKNETRGIIVLTHHQYVSAFNGETEFIKPARQLKTLLPNSAGILWIWGHEHRFAMYSKNQLDADHIATFGRCIGNGGMPDEHTKHRFIVDKRAAVRDLVLFDKRTADEIPLEAGDNPEIREVGFNGYAMITLDLDKAEINYYAAYRINEKDPGRDQLLISETWQVRCGQINCTGVKDFTYLNDENNRVSYFGLRAPGRAGNITIIQLPNMANSVIDTKKDENTFGGIVFRETITTELTLVKIEDGKFGLSYAISYSATKSGSTNGGPINVGGNETFQANASPLVIVTITDYADSGNTISMHVVITVAIPVLGTKIIFDETLAGPYSATSNLATMMTRIAEISKQ